jgi:hypothetical protein
MLPPGPEQDRKATSGLATRRIASSVLLAVLI